MLLARLVISINYSKCDIISVHQQWGSISMAQAFGYYISPKQAKVLQQNIETG